MLVKHHKYSKKLFKNNKKFKSKRNKKVKSKRNKKVKSKRNKKVKSKRNKKQRGGTSELGSLYNAGGVLSTSYTLNGNISPYESSLANPIPINTYSKCPS